MKKKFQEKNDIKLLSKQRVLFRAFVVNTVLVLLIWALTFIPSLMYFGNFFWIIFVPWNFGMQISIECQKQKV